MKQVSGGIRFQTQVCLILNSCAFCDAMQHLHIFVFVKGFDSGLLSAEPYVATQKGSKINILGQLSLHSVAKVPSSPWVLVPALPLSSVGKLCLDCLSLPVLPHRPQSAYYLLPIKMTIFGPWRQKMVNAIHLSVFHARNITGVTYSLLSVHYPCISLSSSAPGNTEKEDGGKSESPPQARKGKTKKKKPRPLYF